MAWLSFIHHLLTLKTGQRDGTLNASLDNAIPKHSGRLIPELSFTPQYHRNMYANALNRKWTDLASAAERLYERNPGTTCPSSDGQWYDNAAATVVSSWLGENGWSLADGILEPDAKARNYGPPQLNVSETGRTSISWPVVTFEFCKPFASIPTHTFVPGTQS